MFLGFLSSFLPRDAGLGASVVARQLPWKVFAFEETPGGRKPPKNNWQKHPSFPKDHFTFQYVPVIFVFLGVTRPGNQGPSFCLGSFRVLSEGSFGWPVATWGQKENPVSIFPLINRVLGYSFLTYSHNRCIVLWRCVTTSPTYGGPSKRKVPSNIYQSSLIFPKVNCETKPTFFQIFFCLTKEPGHTHLALDESVRGIGASDGVKLFDVFFAGIFVGIFRVNSKSSTCFFWRLGLSLGRWEPETPASSPCFFPEALTIWSVRWWVYLQEGRLTLQENLASIFGAEENQTPS